MQTSSVYSSSICIALLVFASISVSQTAVFYNITESPSISGRFINIKHSCKAEGNGITCAKIVEPASRMLICPVLKTTHRLKDQV